MAPDLVVDPTAATEIRAHGSAAQLVVQGCTDRAAARAALELAERDLWEIPHPDEPDGRLPSFANVDDTDDGPRLWFDIEDEGPRFADRIVDLVAGRLRDAGVGGVLRGGHGEAAPDDGADDPDEEYRPQEWFLERPARPWPADLPAPADAAPTVLGTRRHGEPWLLAHWDGVAGQADQLVARLAADGWAVVAVPPDRWRDAELVGPFSEGAPAPGLRLWRAEREGRRVVVGSAGGADDGVLRMTTPLEDVPATRPTAAPGWPPGFPADLPTVTDAAGPPVTGTAPGPGGRPWRQAQLGRRSDRHAQEFVDALTSTGWTVDGDDDRARAALAAAFAARGGPGGGTDVRGWRAGRGEEQLHVISVRAPGGALLVVSTPVG